MSELIDRQDLLERLNFADVPYDARMNYIIMNAPTATPHTTCANCTHYKTISKEHWCMKMVRHTEPDFYCAYGEKDGD